MIDGGGGGFGTSPQLSRQRDLGEVRASADATRGEARRLRNHRLKIIEANSAEELQLAFEDFVKPGLDIDGVTVKRDQREVLYEPRIIREGGTWFATIQYTE